MVENEDTLTEALGYLTNIRRLLQGAVPKESGISFEPFALSLRKKKDRNIGRHGESARLSKKNRNVKVDLPKITRPNSIETETVILEDPLPEKKQKEVFELSSEEEKEELQLHKNLEANKLSDEEIQLITGNSVLTDLTISKCQKILKNQFHVQNGPQDTVVGQKLIFKKKRENLCKYCTTESIIGFQ